MREEGFDGRAVANCLLDFAGNLDVLLTNLHLQKVIFFSHCDYLSKYQRPLIVNRFEAWELGPVIPELYHALKQYGDKQIAGSATRFDFVSKEYIPVSYNFPDVICEHLKDSLLSYGRMDPWALVRLSHAAGGPWDVTINAAKQRANFGLVIEPAVIEASYRGATKSCGRDN